MWSSFIDSFIEIVKGQCKIKGFSFPSVIIAQAFLETGFFEDEEAQLKITNNNFLGIKYKENRVQSFSHLFNDGGWEIEKGERVDLDPSTLWYGFYNVAQCIVGYFEFTSASWYDKLRECTDAESYCYALKECGYATDPNYADKLINLINRYELKQYDNEVIKESENNNMNNGYLIALDDGHGMETYGKRTPPIPELNNRVIKENEFNRAVVGYLDIELQRCGFKTLLVAPTDADTPLSARVALANTNKADAYVSIHYNAFDGKFDGYNPSGNSIFHYPNAKDSEKLATCIYNYLQQGTQQVKRGVKSADFYVLRETNMTAVLSENGFMDNKEEALLMIDVDFQKEVAREHAQGLCDYFNVPYVAEDVKTEENNDNTTVQELYRVQVGAYGVKANAENMLAKLKEAGFDGFITN